jgi:hypothetical protein
MEETLWQEHQVRTTPKRGACTTFLPIVRQEKQLRKDYEWQVKATRSYAVPAKELKLENAKDKMN